MEKYESLLVKYENKGVKVEFTELKGQDGVYCNYDNTDIIVISDKVEGNVNKHMVLLEELGHYKTCYGNITDQNNMSNIKLELKGHRWAYRKIFSPDNLIKAYEYGVNSRYELADFFDVTEEFIERALEYLKTKHGSYVEHKGYRIYFQPCLAVNKINNMFR